MASILRLGVTASTLAIWVMLTTMALGEIMHQSSKNPLIQEPHHMMFMRPPKMPNWDSFMRFFNKRYSSLSQQMLRHKLFLVQVMESFITKIKFKIKQLKYFTEINKFSDLTPDEGQRVISGDLGLPLGELKLTQDAEAEVILNDMIAEREARGRARRRRRSPSTDIRLNPNYRPPRLTNRLVESSVPIDEQPIQDIPEDKVKELEKSLERGEQSLSAKMGGGLVDMVRKGMNWLGPDEEETEEEEEDENREADDYDKNLVIIHDWRNNSDCIGPVIDQGACESCYAVTTTNFMEWSLCQSKETKEFIKLSVQYLISCGLQFSNESGNKYRFSGCDSGTTFHSFEFFKRYGLLPDEHMPYEERVTECPVEAGAPTEERGYFKPRVDKVIRLARTTTKLDLALKAGPVIVTMWEPRYFLGYGGGVVADCEKRGGHASLLVGTATQEGEEYLLIKNSFGPYWGEEGYYKFQRSSIEKCVKEFIVPRVSFTTG